MTTEPYILLGDLLTKYLTPENTSNEIEFKFGQFDNVFKTGVRLDQFSNIAEVYKKKELLVPEKNNYLNIMYNDTRIQILDNTKKQIVEFARTNIITKSMNYNIISKTRDNNDNTLIEYGIKLSLASEENITNHISLDKINYDLKNHKKPILYRYIERYTFNITAGLKLDLSITKQGAGSNFLTSKVMEQPQKYEVELEIYEYDSTIYNSDFNKIVLDNIYKIALIINGGFSLTKFSVCKKIRDEFLKKYTKNIHAHNISLSKKDVDTVKSKYHVFTDKTDGFRHLLFINNFGECYLVNNKMEVFNTEIIMNDIKNSLFDGELFYVEEHNKYEFNIFDVLFINNTDLRSLEFFKQNEVSYYSIRDEETIIFNGAHFKQNIYYDMSGAPIDEFNLKNRKILKYSKFEEIVINPETRYGAILNIFSNGSWTNEKNTLSIMCKSFYPLNMISNISEKYHILVINTSNQTITMPHKPYTFDGLIIQLAAGTYPIQTKVDKNPQWNDSYKWKFLNNITIDFKITDIDINLAENRALASLCDSNNKVYERCEFKLINGRLLTRDNNNVSNNLIVECNFENNTWNLIKIRHDKITSNAAKTILSTVELIKNPVMLEELLDD